MYVRFFVFVLANKKRCGKENEVIKPQASVPSLSSKRNNSPTRCKRSYHKKGCQIFASTIDMVLHVRFISKCKEQLINKLFIEKIVKQKLLFYQWKEVKKKVEGRSEKKVIKSFQIPLPFFWWMLLFFLSKGNARHRSGTRCTARSSL